MSTPHTPANPEPQSRVLGDIASLIRSKNAGPYVITCDVMFESEVDIRDVVDSRVINPEAMGALFRVDPAAVRVFLYEPALAIKISFPRRAVSGDLDDYDVTGGQHYAPLVLLPIPSTSGP